MKILIGTPVHRAGAYVLDKFLANQQEIQRHSPSCELVLATCEPDFLAELKNSVSRYNLRAEVIFYKVAKPEFAKSRFWNIASGREAIRKYFLARSEFEELLFLDADMVFGVSVVDIMARELTGYDSVFSGYKAKIAGIGLTGAGCLIMTRLILQKLKFHCYEYKNGAAISEDNTLEVDLFRLKARIKKGLFVPIDHYTNSNPQIHIDPQKLSVFTRIRVSPLIRYCVIQVDMLLHYNLSWQLFLFLSRISRKR